MPATIITIAQQKGGAGKTTLAAHLALAWAATGQRVAVIDIDPQASLSTWFQLRRSGAARPAPRHRCRRHHRLARRGRGRAPGAHATTSCWSTARRMPRPKRASPCARRSLVLVPVQPSPMDLWATKATLDLARAERVPALLVLNRVPPRANLTEAMLAKFLGARGAGGGDARSAIAWRSPPRLPKGAASSKRARASLQIRAAEEIAPPSAASRSWRRRSRTPGARRESERRLKILG